ncbi:MAG: arabinose efflux permease family protein [Ignavibacteria bacterium]|nr:MAG: arabinose efflux permease family protein [Ignavibacteria bacterium]KAF0159105.1 MAG: arabinose efflux permease family protein [Ignavibacteria bacterium]
MNPYKGLNNIPRSVWVLSLATLINRSGTMVLPFLAIYINREIGVTPSAAGMVLMIYGFGAFLTSPFVGKLSDKISSLTVMRISLFATGIMIILYSLITDYILILLVTFIWAVISEAFRPANLSLISFETTSQQRKTAFALNRLAINLGMSIGPVIGGFLTQVDYSLLFYINGASSILSGLFLSMVKIEGRAASQKVDAVQSKNEINNKQRFNLFSDKKFLFFMAALIPVNLVYFQFLGGLPLYIVNELCYSEATFGLLMSINTIMIVLIEVPLNNAMANWDDRKSLALGSLLAAIGFGMMCLSSSLVWIVITIIIWTFGEMIFFPSSASYSSVISPEERRGEYMGYYQMVFSFAFMFGPWLGAVALDKLNSTILWSGAFVFASVSTFMFMLMMKKETK